MDIIPVEAIKGNNSGQRQNALLPRLPRVYLLQFQQASKSDVRVTRQHQAHGRRQVKKWPVLRPVDVEGRLVFDRSSSSRRYGRRAQ